MARYQMTDSAQMFASYSTGYIAGGYDSLNLATSDNPLRPQESENIELGVKGDFVNDRLRLQLALFSMDIEGRQRTVDSRPPGTPNPIPTINIGNQTNEGVELVLDWLPTDSMRFSFITTWRDSEATWDEFYDANGDLRNDTSGSTTDTDYTVTLGWSPEISRGDLDVRIDYIFNENTSMLDEFSIISILFGTPFTSVSEPMTYGVEFGFNF